MTLVEFTRSAGGSLTTPISVNPARVSYVAPLGYNQALGTYILVEGEKLQVKEVYAVVVAALAAAL